MSEDKDDVEEGMEEESKEHPSLSKKVVKTIVTDHLNMDDDYYEHEKGFGGGGGSPCKFRKREGTLDDKRMITGKHCRTNFD